MPARKWWPWKLENLRSGGEKRLPGKEGNAVFRQRLTMRQMRLMIDAEIGGRDTDDERGQYLMELTDGDCFERYLFADDGPPEDIPRSHQNDDWVVADGWVYTRPGNWPHLIGVEVGQGKDSWRTAISAEDSLFDLLPAAEVPAAYLDLPQPAAKMRADLIALLVADQIEADLFVTARAFLLDGQFDLARATTVLHPIDALPVVGLFLRSQNDFVVRRSHYLSDWGERPPRWFFFWAAAHHVLPASHQWSSVIGAHAKVTNDDGLTHLAASLHHRVAGALDARDRLLAALSIPQGNQSGEDAWTLLTQICLWLMGAFDVAAQVADRCLGLNTPEQRIGWQYNDWRKAVKAHDQALACLVKPGSDGAYLLAIVRELRNSIHGEVLSSSGYQEGSGPVESLVGIPRSREAELLGAMDALGGREAWGAKLLWPGNLHLFPGDFLEEMVPRVLGLLDALIAATPVLQLPGATTPIEEDRSAFEEKYPFHPMLKRAGSRIRWQLGL